MSPRSELMDGTAHWALALEERHADVVAASTRRLRRSVESQHAPDPPAESPASLAEDARLLAVADLPTFAGALAFVAM